MVWFMARLSLISSEMHAFLTIAADRLAAPCHFTGAPAPTKTHALATIV
jgi:hypothetical protein